MLRDLRHALRILVKQPAVTVLAILAIAVGIAANASIFSIVESVLLRPLPYRNADRLIFIRADFRGESGLPGLASAEIEDIRSQSKLIQSIGWMNTPSASLTGDGQLERVSAARVSDDFLAVLGVTPAAGRMLTAKGDIGDLRPRNLMISYELWQRRYHGDANIIGRSIEVNNSPATVVGVLPEGFRLYLGADSNVTPQIDIWFPGDNSFLSRNSHSYHTVARLRNNVTTAQAQAEIDAITDNMIANNPSAYPQRDLRLHVSGLQQDVVKPVRTFILVLLGAVGFVLLIACANVANLLLARASGRSAEIAIRTALGAGHARVIRQMLTESLLLALAGGVAGLLLAQLGINFLLYLKPDNLRRLDAISLNWAVTIFALALSLLSGILFGLAPALQALKMDVQSALRESGRSKTSSARGSRVRSALVTVQVAASLILLIGAVLMIRTFENMRRLDLGFDPANLLTLRVDYDSHIIRGIDTWRFYQRAIEAVQSQPGIESVSAANFLPFDPITWTDDLATEENPEQSRTALYNPVLPGYFHTMSIPLVAGRDFTERDNDDAASVVIVDQDFAQRTWPNQNALGKRLILHPQSKDSRKILEVVGVARATRERIQPDERPLVYVPFGSDYGFFLMMVVRTKTDPASAAPLIRHTIEGIGGKRPVWDIRTMNDYLEDAMAETRFTLILLGTLSTVALFLSVIGVYGVVSYSIAERMHDFASRIAIGAQARDILHLSLAWGLTPAIAGAVIGVSGALALTRFLSGMLFHISPTDGKTYAIASLTVLGAALPACYLPVRRLALRVDPRKFLQ
jgi:putative ABC transport system permease protein